MNLDQTLNYFLSTGDKSETKEKNIYLVKLVNLYSIIFSIIFFTHSLHGFIKMKNIYIGVSLLCVSLFFILSLFLKNRTKNISNIYITFIAICFIVFIYESYIKMESGVFVYYFPLALTVPFIFDINTDKKYILSAYLVICTLFIISLATNSNFFSSPNKILIVYKDIFRISFIFSTLIIAVNIFLFLNEKRAIDKLRKDALEKEITLKQEVNYLSDEEQINSIKIINLNTLAKNNAPSFFHTFSELYPSFYPALLNINPNLSITELELCAFIKLNFSTKDIARNTSSSIRAIEGRKYRLRKKLNFNSDKELILWMLSINLSKKE